MILSFSKKFIFLKAPKTAGTSIETALIRSCDPEKDLLSPERTTERPSSILFQQYLSGYCAHVSLQNVITSGAISQEQANQFAYISVIRNPWDINVSRWWMHVMKVETLPHLSYKGLSIEEIKTRYLGDFDKWVQQYFTWRQPRNDEELYWFDEKGRCWLTHAIRFERLEEDYRRVCAELGLQEYPLPKIHSEFRVIKDHYSCYYTEETKNLIAFNYEKTLQEFGYSFEKKEKWLITSG